MGERDVFTAARAITDPVARAAYLDRACASDTELRDRVEALLRADGRPDSLLDAPAVGPPAADPAGTRAYDGPGDEPIRTHADAPDDDTADALACLAPPARPGSLGRLGHYEVLEVLGRGGFGVVFRAFDDVLQRVVAVKALAPRVAATSPARKRFLREARAAAQVRHDNVVQVHAVDEHPLPHLVMEFVPGETLQQRIDRTGPLDVPEVLRVGRQVADGLAAAHAQGLVHRDVKPSNILIEGGPRDRVKLTDFGLARAADDASLTRSGVVAGTPLYMAPEQAKGEPLDHRADLFSLGSVLYVMLTGRPPFRAETTLAVLRRVAEDDPRPIREVIPEVPEWLCRVVSKLHAKDPTGRFQTAREVADLLADCEAQVRAHGAVRDFARIPGEGPARRLGGTRRAVGAAVAAAALLGGLALAWYPLGLRGARLSPSDPPAAGRELAVEPARAEPVVPAADGWVPLFNGRDLTGWARSPRPSGDWRVRGGVLEARTPFRDYLYTARGDYRNFHLRVEAKVSPGGDGGLMFRCEHGLGSKFGTTRGYEAELSDLPGVPHGSLRTGPVGPDNTVLAKAGRPRAGEWFTQEVIARGGRIVIKVDGEVVLDHEARPEHYTRGHIALQVWGRGTELSVRRVEVRELPDAPPPAVAPFDAKAAREHQGAWARHLGVPAEFANDIGMTFRLIPPGECPAGTAAESAERLTVLAPAYAHDWIRSEVPRRTVRVPRAFYLGATEVTLGQFRRFADATGYRSAEEVSGMGGKAFVDGAVRRRPEYTWRHPDAAASDDHPAVQLLPEDAEAFCRWLRERDGRGYALPTEDEWEYACRAGTTTEWSCGDDPDELGRHAWLDGGWRAVGGRRPNPFGLFDMHGNVEELCRTARGGYVQRGGETNSAPVLLRSASRAVIWDGASWRGRGFRVLIAGELKPRPASRGEGAIPPPRPRP